MREFWTHIAVVPALSGADRAFPAILALSEDLLETAAGSPQWLQAVLLAFSTLLSEDLAAISGGILAGAAPANLPAIFLGCWAGMWCGDMVYYLLGYILGRPALSLPLLRRIVPGDKCETAARWFSERGIRVLVVSRILPGTRPATYLAAGVLRFKPARFIAASLTLSFLWAWFLILLAMKLGTSLMDWAEKYRLGILSPILTILLILIFVLVLAKLPGRRWRGPEGS
jgi:membrane protein DedA with SNARE-associated domain